MKGKRLVAAFAVLLVAIATIAVRLPSASAGGSVRYTPGTLRVANGDDFTLHVYNPTAKEMIVEFRMEKSFGFESTTPIQDTILPGEREDEGFFCLTGICPGVPVIVGPKGLVPSAHYQPDGSTDLVDLPANDFMIVK